eukprot:4682012-Prymnesium_polylepis.1
MWLTGGPGCSSEVALFGENGPCSVNADGTDTISNPYSWNSRANLLYVDQPTGTGFSYGTGLDHNEKGVAADLYAFLQAFFKAHAALAPLDFFVVGESCTPRRHSNTAPRARGGSARPALAAGLTWASHVIRCGGRRGPLRARRDARDLEEQQGAARGRDPHQPQGHVGRQRPH